MLSLVLPQKVIAQHEGCAGVAAWAAHPAVLHLGCEEGASWRGACFKGFGGALLSCLAVPLACTLRWLPRPVDAPVDLNASLCFFGGFWGPVSLLLSQQPDEGWGMGSCLMGSCCILGAGEDFGFLWVVYTPRVL